MADLEAQSHNPSLSVKKELVSEFVKGLDAGWRTMLFNGEMMKILSSVLSRLYALYQDKIAASIAPAPELVFNAFRLTPWDKIHTVIIGQDPYYTKGTAHGLSFSSLDKKIPPSLNTVYKALVKDSLLTAIPKTANLTSWAKGGVLMLNSFLTTEIGKAKAHPFWSAYTTEIIRAISRQKDRIIFMLWGNDAKTLEKYIDGTKHMILKSVHPSPMAQNNLAEPAKFWNTGIFAKATAELKIRNITMDWLPVIYADDGTAVPVGPEFQGTVIFTDGGRVGHMGKTPRAGYAAYVRKCPGGDLLSLTSPEGKPFNIIYGKVPEIGRDGKPMRPTNIRGELLGVYYAIKIVNDDTGGTSPGPILIVSDSEYSIRVINEWYPNRLKNGTENELKNLDLIRPIIAEKEKLEASGKHISFLHTYAHRDRPNTDRVIDGLKEVFTWEGNFMADKYATMGMDLVDTEPRYLMLS